MVEGLLLININPCAEGWMDWAAHKVTLTLGIHLRKKETSEIKETAHVCRCPHQLSGLTHALPDTIISHLFGKVPRPLPFCLTPASRVC